MLENGFNKLAWQSADGALAAEDFRGPQCALNKAATESRRRTAAEEASHWSAIKEVLCLMLLVKLVKSRNSVAGGMGVIHGTSIFTVFNGNATQRGALERAVGSPDCSGVQVQTAGNREASSCRWRSHSKDSSRGIGVLSIPSANPQQVNLSRFTEDANSPTEPIATKLFTLWRDRRSKVVDSRTVANTFHPRSRNW
ncbi:hypothetical protein K458DRAFT_406085 [Lentithecium fluviatile CBS 122367]|uniref:Uncharacterized protein n=1 Tax=Lentithecium fluviatile CBS 122367 TaxID=1168545 RepID=A0A6G1IUE4_9PLEO|nr:hypothetical protein K458DRAFT_406085 [Lentithecium fluviatile CBS 122367]